MTKPHPFLRPLAAQAPKPKNLTIKIPPGLAAELDDLHAAAERAGFKLDLDSVCVNALEAAAKSTSKELKKITSEGVRE